MSAARYGRDLLEAVLSRTGRRRGETLATLAMLDAYPAERLTDTTEQETERDTLIALVEGLGYDPTTVSPSGRFERAEVLDYLVRDAESQPYQKRRTLDAVVDMAINNGVIIAGGAVGEGELAGQGGRVERGRRSGGGEGQCGRRQGGPSTRHR